MSSEDIPREETDCWLCGATGTHLGKECPLCDGEGTYDRFVRNPTDE